MEPPPPPSTAAQKAKAKHVQVSKTSPQHLKLQVVDKVPTGDSPYVKAKHVQLIDREPSKTTSLFRSAVNSILKQENPPTSTKLQLINREPRKDISLFRSAINSILKQKEVGDEIPSIDGALKTQPSSPIKYKESEIDSCYDIDSFYIDFFYERGRHAEEQRNFETACSLYRSAIERNDRYDDAVKDLAFVLQRMGETEKAIELIEKHQNRIEQHQDCLDDLHLSLYKGSGRIDEYIELLQHKLVEEGSAFGGERTKIARSQERKCHGSIKQKRSRLLGNLAWAYMQQENYHSAEPLYREALSIESDKNKQCNLAICLMNSGRISEAKSLLQAVTPSYEERKIHASYIKAYDSALKTLSKLGHSDSIEEHL